MVLANRGRVKCRSPVLVSVIAEQLASKWGKRGQLSPMSAKMMGLALWQSSHADPDAGSPLGCCSTLIGRSLAHRAPMIRPSDGSGFTSVFLACVEVPIALRLLQVER